MIKKDQQLATVICLANLTYFFKENPLVAIILCIYFMKNNAMFTSKLLNKAFLCVNAVFVLIGIYELLIFMGEINVGVQFFINQLSHLLI